MASDSDYFVIQTAGLTKVFRDFWGHQRVLAVDNLDLEIQSHEIYGLLGPNGSGKSTTIKVLLGLLFASRGVAKVMGRPPGDVKTNRRIGYLPEESYLYPFLNARETLDFYGRLFNLSGPERKRRIDSLLDMVGLASVSRRPIGEYSKGMIRRIGLAQALINDPELLILDEPTSGLDPIGTRQIKDLIIELGRRGKTVLLCSHLLADVEDVCDRIGILYGGKLRREGTLDDLLVQSEITQIRSATLSSNAVDQIRKIIHQEHPESNVDIQNPRDRLEDYFLHVVSEAQTAQLETSGAIIGGGMSHFLGESRSTESNDAGIIEQLVVGREHEVSVSHSTPAEPVPVKQVDVVRQDVLDSLVDTTKVETASGPGAPSSSKRLTTPAATDTPADTNDDRPTAVDTSLIDRLVGKSDSSQQSPSRKGAAKKQDNEESTSNNA